MKERNPKTMAMLELTGAILRDIPESKLYVVTRAVYDLQKIAGQLHKRYEAACSYEYANTDRYNKRTENLESKAVSIGKEIGVTIGHQRDPRGWPLIVAIGNEEHRLA